jgi:hypothetical protein
MMGATGVQDTPPRRLPPLGDHAPNLSPPETTLTADCPKRWQRPRVSPASDRTWRHRELLSDERRREYVGVVVVGLAYERGQRLRLPLPPSWFLGRAICREALPEGVANLG